MLDMMKVNTFMTLDDTLTRPDPTSVTAVGKPRNWLESVFDSIAQKQRERFSAATHKHMAFVDKTIAKRIEKGMDAPAPCSLEDALKGICCKKDANARVNAFQS
jgi:hypothetical protein